MNLQGPKPVTLSGRSIRNRQWPFSRRIMVSETFRNIPKVSESFGDRSLDYKLFTYVVGPVMPF